MNEDDSARDDDGAPLRLREHLAAALPAAVARARGRLPTALWGSS